MMNPYLAAESAFTELSAHIHTTIGWLSNDAEITLRAMNDHTMERIEHLLAVTSAASAAFEALPFPPMMPERVRDVELLDGYPSCCDALLDIAETIIKEIRVFDPDHYRTITESGDGEWWGSSSDEQARQAWLMAVRSIIGWKPFDREIDGDERTPEDGNPEVDRDAMVPRYHSAFDGFRRELREAAKLYVTAAAAELHREAEYSAQLREVRQSLLNRRIRSVEQPKGMPDSIEPVEVLQGAAESSVPHRPETVRLAPKQLRRIFGCDQKTLLKKMAGGLIRAKSITDKEYEVETLTLPKDWRSLLDAANGR